MVRNIRSLNGRLFVGVRTRLLTDQPQLTHQSSNLEAPDDSAVVIEHALDCSATSRAATFGKETVYLSLQGQTLNIHELPPLAVLVIAGTADIKRIADHFNGHLLT